MLKDTSLTERLPPIILLLVRQTLDMPNPFFDKDEAPPGMSPAAIGYRYRKFALG